MSVTARSMALAALLGALTLAAGCGRRHHPSEEPKAEGPAAPAPAAPGPPPKSEEATPERPPEKDETVGGPRKMSVDEEIEEALKKVDPVVLYKRVPIPDDENAFTLWKEASELYEEFHEGWEGDDPLWDTFHNALRGDLNFPSAEAGEALAAWIERHRKAIKLVDEGIMRGRCQFPEPKGPDDLLPWLAPLRGFARLRLLKAKKLAGAGDFRAASREVRRVIRMGEMIQDGEGGLIHWLVGIAVQGIGAGGARWLASKETVPERVLEDMIAGLTPDARAQERLALTYRIEFTCFFVPTFRKLVEQAPTDPRAVTNTEGLAALISVFDMESALRDANEGNETTVAFAKMIALAAGKKEVNEAEKKLVELLQPGAVRLLDLRETLQTAAGYYARLVENARAHWKDRDRNMEREFELSHEEWLRDLKSGVSAVLAAVNESRRPSQPEVAAISRMLENPLGKILTSLLLPAAEVANERAFRARADKAATRAILALRLREMRKVRLPDSLQALVDEGILDSVPVDPFSDRPLRYSKSRRVVWSVGADETDDSGRDQPGTWTGKDYVWRVLGGR